MRSFNPSNQVRGRKKLLSWKKSVGLKKKNKRRPKRRSISSHVSTTSSSLASIGLKKRSISRRLSVKRTKPSENRRMTMIRSGKPSMILRPAYIRWRLNRVSSRIWSIDVVHLWRKRPRRRTTRFNSKKRLPTSYLITVGSTMSFKLPIPRSTKMNSTRSNKK